MAKLYAATSKDSSLQNPKKETINLLLNYSKALSVIKCNEMKFTRLLN